MGPWSQLAFIQAMYTDLPDLLTPQFRPALPWKRTSPVMLRRMPRIPLFTLQSEKHTGMSNLAVVQRLDER